VFSSSSNFCKIFGFSSCLWFFLDFLWCLPFFLWDIFFLCFYSEDFYSDWVETAVNCSALLSIEPCISSKRDAILLFDDFWAEIYFFGGACLTCSYFLKDDTGIKAGSWFSAIFISFSIYFISSSSFFYYSSRLCSFYSKSNVDVSIL